MRKLLSVILTTALLFSVVPFPLAVGSVAASEGIPAKLISSGSGWAGVPAISGDKVVWEGWNDENSGVYLKDLATGEERLVSTDTAGSSCGDPSISSNRIVWPEYHFIEPGKEETVTLSGPSCSVHAFDLATDKEILVATDTAGYVATAIFGDKVAWTEYRYDDKATGPTGASLYVYDLATNEKREISNDPESLLSRPVISGNRLVWSDYKGGDFGAEETTAVGSGSIHVYDLITGEQRLLATDTAEFHDVGISGDKIVWDNAPAIKLAPDETRTASGPTGIHLFDFSTGEETTLTASEGAINPAISGDEVVWQGGGRAWVPGSNPDIYAYDLKAQQERRITTDPREQSSPAISGNKVVWQDCRSSEASIYMADLSDPGDDVEPPSIPTNLSAASHGDGLRVSWSDSFDNLRVAGYQVEKNENQTGWSDVATVTATSYEGPSPFGSQTLYRVQAFDEAGNYSKFSKAVVANRNERLITTSGSAFDPDISGDKIAWEARSNYGWPTRAETETVEGIRLFDLSSGEERQLATDTDDVVSSSPAISGDTIAWTTTRFSGDSEGACSIRILDLSTGKERTIEIKGSAYGVDIAGDKVVWEEYRSASAEDDPGSYDIFLYDLSTGEMSQLTKSGRNYSPSISGEKVVWEEDRGGEPGENEVPYASDIYLLDLTTGGQSRISKSGTAFNPSIDRDRVVWEESHENPTDEAGESSSSYSSDIYLLDLSSGESPSAISKSGNATEPSISGDRVVWMDYQENDTYPGVGNNIHLYDIPTGQERQITKSESAKSPHAISGDKIVWQDSLPFGGADIRLYDIDKAWNEGSGLLDGVKERALSSPLNLAVVQTNETLSFSWTASEDSGAAGYRVETSEDGEGWNLVETTTATGCSSTPTPNKLYKYRVCAYDAEGNLSEPSNVVEAVYDTVPPTTTISVSPSAPNQSGWYKTKPTVTLSSNEPGTTFYRWNKAKTWKAYDGPINVAPGKQTLYFYSQDAVGNPEDYKTQVFQTDIKKPTIPTALKAKAIGAGMVVLDWHESTDDMDTIFYLVERSENGSTAWVGVGSSEEPHLATTDVMPNKTYFYRVKATDLAGNVSAASAVASAKTSSPNDTNADSRSDAIAFYDYGNGIGRAWVFKSAFTSKNPAGTRFAVENWREAPKGEIDRAKDNAVTGDFTGDGKTDVMVMKNDGNATTSLWLYVSTGSGFAAPKRVFSAQEWEFQNNKLAAGDYNADGKDELVSFYKYGPTTTKAFLFERQKSGSYSPRQVFASNGWDWKRTKLLSVTAGGKNKVAAVYDYGNAHTALWMFEPGANGVLTPEEAFDAPAGTWDASRSRFVATDVNADGASDLVAFYDYGNATTGVFLLKGTGKAGSQAVSPPEDLYTMSEWDVKRSTFIAGDFNGDGKADVGAAYDYGNSSTALWLFTSNGKKLSAPVRTYQTSQWNNRSATWLMPY